MSNIGDNIRRIRERVETAARRSGRDASDVTIVAVTKTFGAATVNEIVRAGLADIGENRVQEMLAKMEQVEGDVRWHLVGPLQRNKAGKVVGRVHRIHGIDGVRVAGTVDRIAGERGVRVAVLLEVNTSGEDSKHGVEPDGVLAAGTAIAAMPNLDLRGLMTIGPLEGGPEETRACFRRLAELVAALRRETGRPLPELSMGMSEDFEMAIEEGATLVRLGRVITGDRPAAAR